MTQELVSPIGDVSYKHLELSPRIAWSKIRTVGLLDNTKPKAGEVLWFAADALRARNPALQFVHVKKDGVATPATEAQLDQARACDVVLVGTAECGSCTSWCVHDCAELERLGTPSVLIGTTTFETLARYEAETFGYGAVPFVLLEHPISGQPTSSVLAKVSLVADRLADLVHAPAPELMREHLLTCTLAGSTASKPDLISAPDQLDDVLEFLAREGWTDGLPVIPPTPGRVRRMLGERDPAAVAGLIPPRWAPATLELCAVAAVMAGCHPRHFPLLVEAVAAAAGPGFDLYGLQATTHPAAPLLIFNGPIPAAAGVHGGAGAFGPGFAANATIGRALRLIMWNVGGAHPGVMDRATLGHPGKFTYCIAENEADSPWQPLRVDLGYALEDSTVTVVPAEAPHNINDPWSTSAKSLLHVIAGSMSQPGANNHPRGDVVLVLGPEHASTLAKGGLDKQDIREYLFEHARTPVGAWSPEAAERRFGDSAGVDPTDPDALVPIVTSPARILVLVAGGIGTHSMHIPTIASIPVVTRAFSSPA
jgi:hypothetical protein